MNDFYAPIGPRMKLSGGQISRPLGENLSRVLIGLLFLVLVPLLYVAIFRARKKHAMAIGEWHNTIIGDLQISKSPMGPTKKSGEAL